MLFAFASATAMPTDIPTTDRAALRRAAVAIPVLARERQQVMLLTQRPAAHSTHPGEICFPGGKVDAVDASPLATACREPEEEVGYRQARSWPTDEEEGTVTTSGYLVESFVMIIARDAEIRPNSREVSRYGFLPLSAALALENYRIEKLSVTRDDFGFVLPTPIGPVRGATCALLVRLVKQLCRFGSFEEYACTFGKLAPG